MRLKFIYSFALFAILCIFWFSATSIANQRLLNLESDGLIVYGPLPKVEVDHYSYKSLDQAFDPKLDLARSEEFTKIEFERIILDSLPSVARDNFRAYIKDTLTLSVEYQIDPFWIISIMMVESGFDLNAKSSKNARGLMQIQPETAEHLYQLMGKRFTSNEISFKLHKSNDNIDVGVFYLKKLYQNFGLNYRLATIAYNLGPNKLKKQIDTKRDLKSFSYFVKVQYCYKLLENNFLIQLTARDRNTSQNLAIIPYRNTFFTDYSVQSKFFL
jgi:soluble lytic murein transglycosylase